MFSNRHLGIDKPVEIKFGNESYILDHWIKGLPLKVITHGFLDCIENFNGIFPINNRYAIRKKNHNERK